jgi:Peptidase A4 family
LPLVLVLLVWPATPAGTVVVTPAVAPSDALFHSGPFGGTLSSVNWAGYAVSGATDSVKYVAGSWIQPTLTCTSATRYAGFWVGIDGFQPNSRSVEQTGTEATCSGGTAHYSAWYEFFPAIPVTTRLPIHPGDEIDASVTYVGSVVGFKILIQDVTTGGSVSHTKTVSTALRNSAEWIAEAPCCSTTGKVLPLSDFGTVHFGVDATGVAHTDRATIHGVTHAIGGFPTRMISRINMINQAGTKTKAATSVLTPDGTSFNITWKHPGP